MFFDHGRKSPLGIAAGSLDVAAGLRLAVHIYVDESGEYYDITDGAAKKTKREWRETGWDDLRWSSGDEG